MREYGIMDLNYATDLLDMEKKHKRRIYDVVGELVAFFVLTFQKCQRTD